MIKNVLLVFVLLTTFVLRTYHAGVFPKPSPMVDTTSEPSVFLPKDILGINQLILKGSAYQRGLESGKLTAHLLRAQENELVQQLDRWLPSNFWVQAAILTSILWFQGAEKYIEPWMSEEMYGVSLSAPHEFDYLADGLTRQVAYHGLHEVGQMTVDSDGMMGCTVVALPMTDTQNKSWVLGRNFDFEGGRIFDREKILKWVFPLKGNAFVSVIWAGMVGGVTGINEKGLYISLNAAGSLDFRRVGTPSTLVLTKVLQEAGNMQDAIRIIGMSKMFITDIFVVLDAKTGELYRIEKSPDQMAALSLDGPSQVTNHLISPRWEKDRLNNYRKTSLTSTYRAERAEVLLRRLANKKLKKGESAEMEILKILRDKGEEENQALHFGNRRAIDPLIAAHSVIFNSADQILYVSQGPSVQGAFIGFDLKASFRQRKPVRTVALPRDPQLTEKEFEDIKAALKEVSRASAKIDKKKCAEGKIHLEKAESLYTNHYEYFEVLGDLRRCEGDLAAAKTAWQKSLSLSPAYIKNREELKEKIAL